MNRSLIIKNTGAGLRLFINNVLISLYPNVEAVYFVPISDPTSADWLEPFLELPDDGTVIAENSKEGYTWLAINNSSFLPWFLNCCKEEPDRPAVSYKRIFHRIKSQSLETHFDTANHNSTKLTVEGEDPTEDVLVNNDIFTTMFSDVKSVHFMSKDVSAELDGDSWALWWNMFGFLIERNVIVLQKCEAGYFWWVYVEEAYATACKEDGLNPDEFKISGD